eukprot:sb/3468512/
MIFANRSGRDRSSLSFRRSSIRAGISSAAISISRRPKGQCFTSFYQELPTETSKQPIRTLYLDHVTGYQPTRDQYNTLGSYPRRHPGQCFQSSYQELPTETSKQPIRTRYLDHVTGYQPTRDQYNTLELLHGSYQEPTESGVLICYLLESVGSWFSNSILRYCVLYLLREILNFQESQVKSFETHFSLNQKSLNPFVDCCWTCLKYTITVKGGRGGLIKTSTQSPSLCRPKRRASVFNLPTRNYRPKQVNNQSELVI